MVYCSLAILPVWAAVLSISSKDPEPDLISCAQYAINLIYL
jgi:hypothetical protein